MATNERWFYVDEAEGRWSSEPVKLTDLDEMRSTNKINDQTPVCSESMARRAGPTTPGIPYSRIVRVPLKFSPSTADFLAHREQHFVTVFAGSNNAGKSLLLKQLRAELGQEAYLLQANRFSHIDVLNTRQIDDQEYRRYYDTFIQNYYTAQLNHENNELHLEHLLTNLEASQLDLLFDVISKLLGQHCSLKLINPNSRFSPYYVDIDGQNLRVASTGTRLLFSLLGLLFDRRFQTVLIDEPEIGLSPRIQQALATVLYQAMNRAVLFPHLKHVFIATHSHIFVDKAVLSNNHVVTRSGLNVTVSQVTSPSALHHLQINLLGNDLEVLSLPSAIVLVEGESDQIFLSKLFNLHLPDKRISVVRAGGDGEILSKVHVIKEALGDITTGPYRDRIFAVLDARHSLNKSRLTGQGIRENHVRVWTRNGIEYLYPSEHLCRSFRCTAQELAQINREADPIRFNDISKPKKILAQEIADALSIHDPLEQELKDFTIDVSTAVS